MKISPTIRVEHALVWVVIITVTSLLTGALVARGTIPLPDIDMTNAIGIGQLLATIFVGIVAAFLPAHIDARARQRRADEKRARARRIFADRISRKFSALLDHNPFYVDGEGGCWLRLLESRETFKAIEKIDSWLNRRYKPIIDIIEVDDPMFNRETCDKATGVIRALKDWLVQHGCDEELSPLLVGSNLSIEKDDYDAYFERYIACTSTLGWFHVYAQGIGPGEPLPSFLDFIKETISLPITPAP
ncbi:hypothetical protein [Gimibacter soli]|uniref:Uncharacterized protein n=1 Tax=Gimibacter soli TaxID=3024400 RepID=A0AAE9XPV7_9PROT|nr:hypothetical protein [Gimibacter soli]WCL52911.1 hypothetical protein PH603_10210 [Gimibacter soli]